MPRSSAAAVVVLHLAIVLVLVCLRLPLASGLPSPQEGCLHAERTHREGSEVAMADPCVKCRCVRGVLVCRLRVCAPQPHPPPSGCVVLTRRSECCPRLVCPQEGVEPSRRRLSDNLLDERTVLPSGCLVNGSVYAEGSAMDSSSRCQYCYCIRGRQHCVRPQCLLAETDCVPTYTTDSCCPAKYNCTNAASGLNKKETSTTTSKPTSGCLVDGRQYPEGELIRGRAGPCQHCYCLLGALRCEPVVCSVPVNKHCQPILSPGHCCPVSYNCSNGGLVEEEVEDSQEDMIALNTQSINVNHIYVNSERSITNKIEDSTNSTNSQPQLLPSDITTVRGEELTTLETTITTIKDEMEDTTIEEELKETTAVTTEIAPTTDKDTTIISTTISDFIDVEQRINLKRGEDMTTSKIEDMLTTTTSSENNLTSTIAETSTETNKTNTTFGPEKSLPSEIEAILNQTNLANKDEDYNDYDYNESSLPPSLPNLRIIPFVAADAVVEGPQFKASLDHSHVLDDLHFYEGTHTHPHGFSPPIETEGGFVPKEPLLDGPFYESKFDGIYHSTGNNGASLSVDITSDSLPAITEPPKVMEEEKCVRGGASYRHGELLSAPSACELCVCYYGKVVCQAPKCPTPPPGCHPLLDRDSANCCPKLLCNGNSAESPTRVVDHATTAPHLPPFKVADVVVTPDPFRDVIRTEPAPDLHSLIGDIMPYLWDQSTTTPVSFTTAEPSENNTETTTAASITTTRHEVTTALTTAESIAAAISTVPTTTTTTTTLSTTTPTYLFDLLNFDSDNKTKPHEEFGHKEVTEDEPTEDDFSFDSVFSYLFGNDKWTTTTEKPHPKTKKPYLNKTNLTNMDTRFVNKTVGPKYNQSKPSEQPVEHRIDLNVDDLTDSISIAPVIKEPAKTTHSHFETKKTTNVEAITKLVSTTPVSTTTSTEVPKLTEKVIHHTTNKNLPTTHPPTIQRPTEKIHFYSTLRSPVTKVSTKRYGTKYTSTPKYSRPPVTSAPSADPGAASGLLKLAGCNIYGRMYRVGRIISELSGPCLECMCTEVGVQCRPLKC